MRKESKQLWIKKQEDTYTIGLTPDLQEELGEVNFADITEAEEIEQEETLAEVETSKTVIEITAPLSGKIIQRNEKADEDPSVLNAEDEQENWLVVMEDVSEAQWQQLTE
ncbi:glycine cleavage system protein H [Tetragenococcus halophilus]|uniref:glycine cleavage system protein H n=1 Tax=Tetragenococcus halophilus TaxID=51669 RepID=UPI0025B1FEF5|nr:glycine cleavage system protein H [Tetragenococcus halophilus]WJS82706.1 glycine cleavage system protein H [Tetragenococcus halophilus]